jgi:uncharacterized delta-60 repeat protein
MMTEGNTTMNMKHTTIAATWLSAIMLVLTACSTPKSTLDQEATGYLGSITLTIDPSTQVSDLEFTPNASIDPVKLKFLPGLTNAVSIGGDHFVNSAFSVHNLSGMTLKNLTMVAANTGHPSGTAIISVVGAGNVPVAATDTELKAIKPSHGMTATGVNVTRADLQIFSEEELVAFNTPATVPMGSYLLGYGYVVKNSAGGTTLSGTGPSRLTNRVTVGFKVPTTAWQGYKYQLSYLLFTDDVVARTQSLEETTTVAGQNQSSVNITALTRVKTLLGSTYAGANGKTVCNVRTAGNVGDAIASVLGQAFIAAPGALDACDFSKGGKVLTNMSNGAFNDFAYAVAIDKDNKIVVAGYASNGINNDFAILRLNSNGTPDTTFDGDGKVLVNMSNGAFNDFGRAVSIDKDNKIVIAGYASNGSNVDFAILRLNSNGTPDTTFDGDGKVLVNMSNGALGEAAYAVAIDKDNKIVVAGEAYNVSSVDFAILRLNSNGTPDTAFDGDGKVLINMPDSTFNDFARAVSIDKDNKIVVSGNAYNGNNDDFAILRLSPNGTPDTAFDDDGKVLTNMSNGAFGDFARGVSIDKDNKIVVAGNAYNGNNDDFAILRLNYNGTPDTTFDDDGKVLTNMSNGAFGDFGRGVSIDKDNKIVVAGEANSGINNDFAIIRILP